MKTKFAIELKTFKRSAFRKFNNQRKLKLRSSPILHFRLLMTSRENKEGTQHYKRAARRREGGWGKKKSCKRKCPQIFLQAVTEGNVTFNQKKKKNVQMVSPEKNHAQTRSGKKILANRFSNGPFLNE